QGSDVLLYLLLAVAPEDTDTPVLTALNVLEFLAQLAKLLRGVLDLEIDVRPWARKQLQRLPEPLTLCTCKVERFQELSQHGYHTGGQFNLQPGELGLQPRQVIVESLSVLGGLGAEHQPVGAGFGSGFAK